MSGLRGTLIAAAVALVFALLFLAKCQEARTAGAQARLSRDTGQAAVESGRDAVGTVSAAGARADAGDAIGRMNDESIQGAAGADQPVPPAVAAAVRSGLCRRAAYRDDPRCLRFTPAK
ncbi:hypothetical protein [Novosphingobium sp.]|uniref:hypothetical protein n=1 Tax=Novosphingobium sp. TaxID=1874826 RepID=UPI002628378B|nr:hypothetical protein [Novosphingobium sp.]